MSMNIQKLQLLMVQRGYNTKELSYKLEINEKVLHSKVNGKAKFSMREMIDLIEILKIDNPREIFFT